ncbi:2-hydroxyacid dehydrogenase [Dyadobacter fermentans]|uniref:D-isomer specific 2-hydroxyacid dehydrogenase NAD-binding n=1 Tax=Dyadobacter fermentans (strain ATCC 700827 / DSM 18053 / CIP 107007 / KCTC 52180 / NS114) TaxID=471854 RepID=C6W6K4_DYAFD|nr:2-hydroxyacid dehydrogenase [Dyadobacter fermentans]ACT94344.1 D-isomer specific 2-hydroxyacid dehydrogenase NAD-binding [Dyadobacter fermentans DSM 18053]
MKILITAPYHDKAQQVLKEHFGEVIYKPWKLQERAYNEAELSALLRETGADALITEHDHVTPAVITAFPGLQFIGVCRGTPSNVAVATATSLGIPVFNTPARNAQAVAEMFIANLITLMRNTLAGIAWLKGGHWEAGAHTSYLQFKGNEIAGKTIGMVGFGAVGQTIANLVKHFPAQILYYDPFYTSDDPDYQKVSLEDVFRLSDVVSIHLPVTPETEGMIGAELIGLMKKDAIFVNTARAVVVQREVLLAAIESHAIRGAILDVFDHEPPDALDYRLIHHQNVLATPHIAGATFEVEDHHADIMNKALLGFYKEGNRNVRQLVNRGELSAKTH